MDPQVTKLLQAASSNPTYKLLQEYLTARRSFPEITAGYLPQGTRGEFATNTLFGNELPRHGRLTLSSNVLQNPQDPKNIATLLHELMHAADKQLANQYFETTQRSGLLSAPGTSQFSEAFDKLKMQDSVDPKAPRDTSGDSAEAYAIAPQWLASERGYRASPGELPAFAVGSAAAGVQGDYRPPQHLDPTLATNQSVLLSMALKEMLTRQQSQGR